MRTFLSGDGTDTTATVKAYLQSQRQVWKADLILIGEVEDPNAVWLTDWNSPLVWPLWGEFQPATINRDQVSSEIGLSVAQLKFEWSPPPGSLGTTLATASAYQKALSGFFDNKSFRLWRTIMPTPGDANSYGACEYFGGRISDTTIDRGKITFTVDSFLDVVNQQLPPNVVESQNTLANYAGAVPVLSDLETAIARFVVVAPSSAGNIIAQCTGPTANKVYSTNKFQYGFIVFEEGSGLAGYFAQVAQNNKIKIATINYNQFLPYAPFPWDPQPGDTFYASIQPPVNQSGTSASFPFKGFIYVPQPETAV